MNYAELPRMTPRKYIYIYTSRDIYKIVEVQIQFTESASNQICTQLKSRAQQCFKRDSTEKEIIQAI